MKLEVGLAPRKQRASLKRAVELVVDNDASVQGIDEHEIAGLVVVGIIADLFGTTVERVARAIVKVRDPQPVVGAVLKG